MGKPGRRSRDICLLRDMGNALARFFGQIEEFDPNAVTRAAFFVLAAHNSAGAGHVLFFLTAFSRNIKVELEQGQVFKFFGRIELQPERTQLESLGLLATFLLAEEDFDFLFARMLNLGMREPLDCTSYCAI